ncbi:hypothetical protein [Luteolibacter rhizosphaerae]|uniref:hypothetical protein n=1 Tax=Luteolibacter rhizosphaerae TaxID=2989719 RepID=UPI0031F32869
MKTIRISNWKRTVLGSLALLGILAVILFTLVLKQTGRDFDRREAINHLNQISMALFEFDSEYGSFPNAGTIADVREDTCTELDLGTTNSNQFFRQLFATGLKAERLFHIHRTSPPARRPDEVITKGKALGVGECSWGYLPASSEPSAPLVFGPIIPGTRRFDPVPLRGQALILRRDNSTSALRINPRTGGVTLNRMDFFDPRQPWAKEIKLPE